MGSISSSGAEGTFRQCASPMAELVNAGRRLSRRRHQAKALPPFGGNRVSPANLQLAPAPLSVSSSPRLAAPSPPAGLLRPSLRDGPTEPIPLLPPQQPASNQRPSRTSSNTTQQPVSFKPLHVSAPLITVRIKRTQSWQQLEAVVVEEGHNFNFIHVTAALVHLSKLLQGAGEPAHAPLLSSSDTSSGGGFARPESSTEGFPHQQLMDGSRSSSRSSSSSSRGPGSGIPRSSIHGASPASPSDPKAFQPYPQSPPLPLSGQLLEPPQSNQQQLPPAAAPPTPPSRRSPPAHTALQPPQAAALLTTLLRLVLRELQAMDVQGVANTLHAMAVLRVPDRRLVEQLLAAVQYRLDMGTPQHLANILWSCVVLGHTPDREWMGMYYRALEARLHEYGPLDVSNTMWAFGRLQFEGKQYRVAPDVVRKLLQQAYAVLLRLEPQHLANMLWGLARLGFVPGPTWSQAFLNASGPRLLAMQPPELASLAWAVGKLRMAPGPVWVGQLLLATQPMLPRLQPHQLSQLLLGVATLRARPPRPWMAAALHASLQHVGTYSPQALLQVLRSVALLGGPAAAELPQGDCHVWLAQHMDAAASFLGWDEARAGFAGGGGSSGRGPWSWEQRRLGEGEGSSRSSGRPPEPAAAATAAATADPSAAPAGSVDTPGGLQPCQFRAEELAQLLQALARMRVRPPRPWLARVLQALLREPGMVESLCRDGPAVTMTVWALWHLLPPAPQPQDSRVGAPPPPRPSSPAGSSTGTTTGGDGSSSPLNRAVSAAHSTEPSLLQPLSVQTRLTADPLLVPFLSAVLETTTRLMPKNIYSALELSTLLNKLAGWGVMPPESWMVRFWWRSLVMMTHTYESIRRSNRSNSSSGSGSERLGSSPAAATAAPAAYIAPPPPSTSFLAASTRSDDGSSSSSRSDELSTYALVIMLKSLAQLQARPQEYWCRAMLQTSRMILPSFAPYQFGSVLASMAALKIQPTPGWWRAFLLATYNVWNKFSPKDWVFLVQGLAKQRVVVPQDWLSCFFASTLGSLPAFSTNELVLLFNSLWRLQARFPKAWVSAFLATALSRLPQARLTDLLALMSISIRIMPKLRHRNLRQQWLAGVVAVVRGLLEAHNLPPKELRRLKAMLKSTARECKLEGRRYAIKSHVRTQQGQLRGSRNKR